MLYPSAVFMLNMSLLPDISLSLCHKFNSYFWQMSLNSFLLSSSVKLVLVHKLKPKTGLLPMSDNLGGIYTFVILNMTVVLII